MEIALTVKSPPEVVAFAIRLVHELVPQKGGVVVIEGHIRLCPAAGELNAPHMQLRAYL